MQRIVVLTAVLAALVPPSARAAEGQPVRLYVFARAQQAAPETDSKAREKEADAERKQLEQAAKALDKALEAKHGKSSKDWPEEARRQSDEAWQKALRADLARATAKVDEDLGKSAKSLVTYLKDEVKGSKGVALSESADQAELAVELLARSARTSFPAAAWMLYLKVTPVGSAAAAATGDQQFAQVKEKQLGVGLLAEETVRGAVATVHPYTEAEPYWIIRVFQQGTSYADVVRSAAEVLAALGSGLAEPEGKPVP
jgi:hypothetical protein